MPATQDFEDLYGVTEQRALNFWASNLHETVGDDRWLQMLGDTTGVYIASVLGHFCLQSVDRREILSAEYLPADGELRQFADLTQIAEMMMRQLTAERNPLWMESAGAHILLHAGFFQDQNRHRHNIDFFSQLGKDCYRMAAVGSREKTMTLMARGFDRYLAYLAKLHRRLEEERYIIKPQN